MISFDKNIIVIPNKPDDENEYYDFGSENSLINTVFIGKNSLRRSKDKNDLEEDERPSLGFNISLPFDVEVKWNGKSGADSLDFKIYTDEYNFQNKWGVGFSSYLGNGIFTVHMPFGFETDENIDLLVTSPFNVVNNTIFTVSEKINSSEYLSVFVFNIKVVPSHEWVFIKERTPIAAVVPVLKNFYDDFGLVHAKSIYSNEDLEKLSNIVKDSDSAKRYFEEKF